MDSFQVDTYSKKREREREAEQGAGEQQHWKLSKTSQEESVGGKYNKSKIQLCYVLHLVRHLETTVGRYNSLDAYYLTVDLI